MFVALRATVPPSVKAAVSCTADTEPKGLYTAAPEKRRFYLH
jgi:hypothetical protein